MKMSKLGLLPLLLVGNESVKADLITGPSTSFEPFVVPATGFDDIEIYSIVTAASGETPIGGYFNTGAADGTAAYDNGDGTFTILVNHEIPYIPSITVGFPFNLVVPSFANQQRVLAHGGKGAHVAKWIVNRPDHPTDPLKVISGADLITSVEVWDPLAGGGSGAYVISVAENFQVFCSSDMAPQSAFYDSSSGKGSQVRLYLTGEEFSPFDVAQGIADQTGQTRAFVVANAVGSDFTRLDGGRAFAIQVDGSNAGTAYELAAMGNMNFENAVASPYEQEKTVVILADDDNPGQMYLYVGTKNSTGSLEIDKAGLTNGSLYGMQVNGQLNEAGVTTGDSVTFHNFGDVRSLDWTPLENASDANSVTRFSKPEDLAWDTQNPNRFYFVTSGGTNPARLWRVTLDSITNPASGGTVDILVDGALMPGLELSGFDNIACDLNGDVFVQEDGQSSSLGLSRIWKYTAAEETFTVFAHHNPLYFTDNSQPEFISDVGETSGILDLSGVLGEGWYLLTSMAHRSPSGTDPLSKLEAYEFSPPFYEESQLLVMFIEPSPIEMGFEISTSGGFALNFQRESGYDYQIQRSLTGVSGPWVNFGSVILDGGACSGPHSVPIVPVNGTEEYYRLQRRTVAP